VSILLHPNNMKNFECREWKGLTQNIKYDISVSHANLSFSEIWKQFTDKEFIQSLDNVVAATWKWLFNVSNKKWVMQSIVAFLVFIGFIVYIDREEILQSPQRQRWLLIWTWIWLLLMMIIYFWKKYLSQKWKIAQDQWPKNTFTINKTEITNIIFIKKDWLYNIRIWPTWWGSIKIVNNDWSSCKYYITWKEQSEEAWNILSKFWYIS
jgi:hypothetical protein